MQAAVEMPLRIVFQSPCWPPDRAANGIASYVAGMRVGLSELGVRTSVLTADVPAECLSPDVACVGPKDAKRPFAVRLLQRIASVLSRHLGMQQTLGDRVGRALAAMVRQAPVDLFEVEETFGISRVVAKHFAGPIVLRLHGPWCVVGPMVGVRRDKEFWMRCLAEYVAIRSASAVSAPSQDVLDRVRAFYRMALPNARVIPNPAPDVAPDALWHPEHCDANTLLFVGRFDRVKGADLLLIAFAELAETRPELRLLFVGPDLGLIENERTIGLRDFLNERIPARVHAQIVIAGRQTREEIAAHRVRSAITIVSSRYENFPMVVLEAMAAGSPIVASRSGGIKEIVRDEHSGLLFDPDDAGDLARQVARLLDDPSKAAALAAAARADATGRFSAKRVAEQSHAFYAEILGQR